MNIDLLLASEVALVPIILACVQLYKNLVSDRFHKYSVVVAIILGMVFTWLTAPTTHDSADYKFVLMSGLLLGLSSSGLYSGVKNVVKRHDDI